MSIEKKPFKPYSLEEERGKRDQFTVELNSQQRVWLNDAKKVMDVKSDSVAIKILAHYGKNAMVNMFGDKDLTYLFKKERQRLTDYENI